MPGGWSRSITARNVAGLFFPVTGSLGLIPDELPREASAGLEKALMSILIDLRAQARENKDWATADMIRGRLAEIGVMLEDRLEGTTWQSNK